MLLAKIAQNVMLTQCSNYLAFILAMRQEGTPAWTQLLLCYCLTCFSNIHKTEPQTWQNLSCIHHWPCTIPTVYYINTTKCMMDIDKIIFSHKNFLHLVNEGAYLQGMYKHDTKTALLLVWYYVCIYNKHENSITNGLISCLYLHKTSEYCKY